MAKHFGLASALHFKMLGKQLIRKFADSKRRDFYTANFGVSSIVESWIYKKINALDTSYVDPKKFLFTLYFMKVYPCHWNDS